MIYTQTTWPEDDGDYPYGRCLLLRRRDGSASWVFRFTSPTNGRRREMGLGPAQPHHFEQQVDWATAQAVRLRHAVSEGRDPIDDRDAERDAAKVARLQAKGVTVRRALRIWADTTEKARNWTVTYARDVSREIEHDPPAWLLEIPMAELKAKDVIKALSEVPGCQNRKDKLRQRLDWAMELFIHAEALGANPAGVRRNVRGRF